MTTTILVHAGAPSSRLDDDRYRAQADAYLAFQGHSRNVPHPERDISIAGRANESQHSDLDGSAYDLDQNNTTVFLDDTQTAYLALDSQLVSSSLQIPATIGNEADSRNSPSDDSLRISPTGIARQPPPSSPPDHGLVEKQNLPSTSQSSNIGEITDSVPPAKPSTPKDQNAQPEESQTSYLKTPELHRRAKRRRLSNSLDHREWRPIDLTSIGEQPLASAEGARIAHAEVPNESNPSERTTSELPTSYSLSDITSESSRVKTRTGVSQRSASDPGPSAGSNSATSIKAALTSSGLGRQENQPTGRPVSSESTYIPIEPARRPSPSPKLNVERQRTSDPSSTPSDSPEAILRTLALIIHPPEPEVGTNNYTTHITPTLQNVLDELHNETRYPPTSTLRPLRPLERGHWLLDTSPWKPELQLTFWQFLSDIITKGRAGWGVWCVRNDGEECLGDVGESDGLGLVKVFCWGEVVPHVYFLLYVASKAHVRKLGACWVDAGGEVVVQMLKL